MGKKIIENVKFWKYEAEITFTDNSQISFIWEPDYDVSETEIVEWMTKNNIDPASIENYAYKFPYNFSLEMLQEDGYFDEEL